MLCDFIFVFLKCTVLYFHIGDQLGKMIMRMEEENILLRQENTGLKKLYDDSMSKIRNLESMVLNAESANESLQRKFTNYDNLVDECSAVVSIVWECRLMGKVVRYYRYLPLKKIFIFCT